MRSHEARIIHVTIGVPIEAAYAFTCEPLNFPKWSVGLSNSVQKTDRGWVAETLEGEALVRFSHPNPYGVLDHWVELPGTPEIYIPLRMVANGDATEVELTLFRQDSMSEDDFDRDADIVRSDLTSLKELLEGEILHTGNAAPRD